MQVRTELLGPGLKKVGSGYCQLELLALHPKPEMESPIPRTAALCQAAGTSRAMGLYQTAVGPTVLQVGKENALAGVEMPGCCTVVRDSVCYKTARHS